ncbi:MAG: AI-2E family transporter [Lachnospiraceae bacterium]
MDEEKKKVKMLRGLILFAGFVCLGVIYIKDVCGVFLFALSILTPFVVGAAIAFVLNLPMRFIENKLLGRIKNKKYAGLRRAVSILLAILFVMAIIAFAVVMVIPRLGQTFLELGPVIQNFMQKLWMDIQQFLKDNPELIEQLPMLADLKIDWNAVVSYVTNFLRSGVTNMFSAIFGIAGGIASTVFDAVISLVFAIYLLAGKERLGAQVRRVITAYLPENAAKKVFYVQALVNQNFAKFISGQCLEAVILGTMFVVTMSILRMPYAMLIGVLIAFTALIPIVGAFIGCIVGAFLILMVSPIQAVGFVILFLVLQQIEGNLIYPRVVGSSVGLPAIWVLVAVSIGGSMFGIVGMLLFIPIMSTCYSLLRDNVNYRNKRKQPAEAGKKTGKAVQKNEKPENE